MICDPQVSPQNLKPRFDYASSSLARKLHVTVLSHCGIGDLMGSWHSLTEGDLEGCGMGCGPRCYKTLLHFDTPRLVPFVLFMIPYRESNGIPTPVYHDFASTLELFIDVFHHRFDLLSECIMGKPRSFRVLSGKITYKKVWYHPCIKFMLYGFKTIGFWFLNVF